MGGGRRRGGSLALGLLLLEKLNDKVLILANEVISEASRGKIVTKVLPPLGIKGFQGRELGAGLVAVGTSRARVACGTAW